jgi:hypothetical protein
MLEHPIFRAIGLSYLTQTHGKREPPYDILIRTLGVEVLALITLPRKCHTDGHGHYISRVCWT